MIAKALALRDPQTKETMVSIEKSLLAHKKQGLGQNEELMKLILSKESNLEDLASAISKQAESNRSSYLMPIHIELSELEKLGCKLDKDELVYKLKDKSRQEKCVWGNDRLAEEARKYVAPLLDKHQEAKNKATDFAGFMKAIEEEQQTFKHLGEHHHLALYALDKKNGEDLELFSLAQSTKELDASVALKRIDYALEHGLYKEHEITQELKSNGGNLKKLYMTLNYKCKMHEETMAKNLEFSKSQQTTSKQLIKQLEKDFDGPC